MRNYWSNSNEPALESDSPWDIFGRCFQLLSFCLSSSTLNFHRPLSLVMSRSMSIRLFSARLVEAHRCLWEP